MPIVSMISAERARYVAHFDAAVAEIAATSPETVRELLISIDNEALPYPYRYVRADVVSRAEDGSGRISEIKLDPAPDAEARGFQLGPTGIEVHPFTWCATQIAFDRPLPDLARFEALLTRWLDVDGQRLDASGTANAIHSVTQVESNGAWWYLTVDFGSAPADALIETIDFLVNEAAVGRIVITSQARE